jgi:hypothetical protein
MKSTSWIPTLSSRTRTLATTLVVALSLHAMVPSGLAGPISSTGIVAASGRTVDLATIQSALEHKVVQQRLQDLGFTPTEIQQRLKQASNSELHQLAVESEKVMAGGDGGFIVTVLIIVLLVLLIMRIAAVESQPVTDVLPA